MGLSSVHQRGAGIACPDWYFSRQALFVIRSLNRWTNSRCEKIGPMATESVPSGYQPRLGGMNAQTILAKSLR
jgi:hypothetical protein